jgi:uncharacterized protein Smg (DUF494 family)
MRHLAGVGVRLVLQNASQQSFINEYSFVITIVNPSHTFRVQGPHEHGRFTPDAWGHLLSLRGSGLLTPMDFEYVIERALHQVDGRIALDDLRMLLAGTGLGEHGDDSSLGVH